jgi:flap endonuclease-1
VKAHFQGQGQGQGQGSSGTSPSPSSSPQERIAIQEKLETTTDLDMAEIDAALERITTMIDTLSDLQAAYTAKSATGVSRTTPPGLSAALQHVSELERLHEAIGETSRPRDIYRSPQEEEEISVLDEALEQVVPEEAFRESRRQRSLTEEEGRFINQLLGVPTPAGLDTEKHGLDGMLADRDGGHVEIPPMGRLDDLIQTSPEVKATYQRALNNPTAADHDACRELVMRMGVPVLEAAIPYEAEGLAASLANAGLVDFVGSEDSDVIAYEVSQTVPTLNEHDPDT